MAFGFGWDFRRGVTEGGALEGAELWYRHVNHGERWRSMPMRLDAKGAYRATIPGGYTRSPFPLQYYVVLRRPQAASVFLPSFNETLSNQPYFAVWERA